MLNLTTRFLFLIFVMAILAIDSLFSKSALDLWKMGFLLGFIYIVVESIQNRKRKISFHSGFILNGLLSLFILVYTYSQSMIHLPESEVSNQKFYLRLLFYVSIAFVFYYSYKREEKMVFWATIVGSMTLPTVWGYLLSGSGYGLVFLYSVLYHGKSTWKITPSLVALVLFLFVNAMGYFFHEYQSYYAYGIFLYATLLCLVLRFSEENLSMIRKVSFLYLVYFIITVFIFLIFYYLQSGLANEDRSLGSFQVNSVGGSILFYFPIFTVLFLVQWVKKPSFSFFTKRVGKNTGSIPQGMEKYKNYFLILGFPFVLLLLYLSHTRSAIIASSLFLFYAIYLIIDRFQNKNRIYFFLGIIFIVLIPVAIEYFLNSKSIVTLLIRLDIWRSYIHTTFHEFPYLGAGFNGQNIFLFIPGIQDILNQYTLVQHEMFSGKTTPHSHNFFVQIVLEQGFIGIFLISVFFYLLFTESLFSNRNKFPITFFPKLILLSFMIHQFFDYTIQDPNVLLALALVVGVIQKSSYKWKIFPLSKKFVSIASFILVVISGIPIWILHTNQKQAIALQDYYQLSNFQELVLIQEPDEYAREQSLFLDSLSGGNYMDDRMALYSALVHLDVATMPEEERARIGKQYVTIAWVKEAKKRIASCLEQNPYNPVCKSMESDPMDYYKNFITEKIRQ